MATGYTAISLTDGTTTLNLNDGTTYVLQGGGWSPKIAGRLASTIGNRCPYEDVVEQITVSVLGSSPSNAIANLNAIINLLEQARRYNDLDNVAAVTLNVEPQGVSSGAWKALVLDADVIVPQDWADNLPNNVIEDVQLRIVRRGIWTRSEYTSSTSSSTTMQRLSAAMTITDPGKQGYISEILVTPSADELAGTYKFHPGYIIITSATNKVQYIYDSAGLVNESSNFVNNPTGFVTRTKNGTYPAITIDLATITSPQLNTSATRVAIIGTFKIDSVSLNPAKCSIYTESSATQAYAVNYFNVPSSTAEEVVFVGVFPWNPQVRYITFECFAGGEVRMDCAVLVDVSDPYTNIFSMANSSGVKRQFRAVNGATQVSPYAESKENTGAYNTHPAQGNLWMPFSGTNVYAMRFARGHYVSASNSYWQPVATGPAAITNTFRVKALEATLIPR